jgi:hypothetical protein
MYVGVVPVVRSSRAGKFVVCIGSVVDEYGILSRYGLYGAVSISSISRRRCIAYACFRSRYVLCRDSVL